MSCVKRKRARVFDNVLDYGRNKRRCCTSLNESGNENGSLGLPRNRFAKVGNNEPEPSPFLEVALPKESPTEMAEHLRNEIKKLRKWKQLIISKAALENMQELEGSDMMAADSALYQLTQAQGEEGLFTFKQVQLICADQLIKREEMLRECYESVLTIRLAEQYDTFLKFTYDQIQRRHDTPSSYFS